MGSELLQSVELFIYCPRTYGQCTELILFSIVLKCDPVGYIEKKKEAELKQKEVSAADHSKTDNAHATSSQTAPLLHGKASKS